MKKRNYNSIMLSFLLLMFTVAVNGQRATLFGRVLNAAGEPLATASIAMEGTTLGAMADEDGHYTLADIPAGTYRIKVFFMGYRSVSETVSLAAGQSLEKNFSLQEDALNMETVVVSGTRYEQDRVNNPVVVYVVDTKMLNATQSIAISEGLNFQPGVRVETNCQNCGFTQVRLNGLEGAYSQILINSRPIF